jgi:hypothetical protein
MIPLSYADHLQGLAERGLLPADPVSIFAAGSLVRGFGNNQSDLDIYVVCANQWNGKTDHSSTVTLEPRSIPVHAVGVNGRRLDIEYWTDGQIDQLIEKVSWYQFDNRADVADLLSPPEIDLLGRLDHALALVGEDWVERRREQVRSSATRAVFVSRYTNRADLFMEDAIGQLASGDEHSAVLSARSAFGYAIDALLVYHGASGSSRKWRAWLMRSMENPVIKFDEYWRIESMEGLTPGNMSAWVDEVIQACRRICSEVIV